MDTTKDRKKWKRHGKFPASICEEPMWSEMTKTDHNVLHFFALHCMCYETGFWKKGARAGTVTALAARISKFKAHTPHRAYTFAVQVRESWNHLTALGLVKRTPRGLWLLNVGRSRKED